jgi:hypothetical protein
VRRFVLLAALAFGCSGDGAIPEEALRIECGVDTVLLGQAFPLTVVRTWSKARTPPAWSEETLAPLEVRLVETTRREDGRRVEETRRYQAYAFEAGALETPVAVSVGTVVDPARPGPPELPDAERSSTPWIWLPAICAVVAVLLVSLRRRPVAAPVGAPAPEPAGPEVEALRRIAALRARSPKGRDEVQEFHLDATRVVRRFLFERFGVHSEVRTSEELFARHATLRSPLRHCDLVLFARHDPGADERNSMLDGIERFVRESA